MVKRRKGCAKKQGSFSLSPTFGVGGGMYPQLQS